MTRSKVFRRVAGLRPGRSVFDLTYEKKFTCDMGQLIPVMCDEVVPGDTFKIADEIVIRYQPMLAPILHETNAIVHYFFVPYRLLWDEWEDFITGGVDGDFEAEQPTWDDADDPNVTALYTLWDYFGFPVGVNPVGRYPLVWPRRAYNFVYNEYYRDQNLQDEVDLDNNFILNRAWEKDYFTSALPWQQRGTAPALPVSGMSSAVFTGPVDSVAPPNLANALGFANSFESPLYSGDSRAQLFRDYWLSQNTVDLNNLTTFNVADLRLAFQIQKWLERNARAGARYTEFLRAHFGVAPRDDRLDRPEYIGGSKSPVIVSEVLQTSSTDSTSPQGNLAGHGITADKSYCGKYHAQEFGCIIGILSIMPRPVYQQGIDRQWLRQTKYDYPFVEFTHLSEQAIENVEIFATNNLDWNRKIFGYNGRYDEMRIKRSMVCAGMRDDFDFWHLARKFDPANPPLLNADFIRCEPSKRIFAVENEPGLIVSFANIIRAVRPIPVQSNPGLIDHF